MPLLMIPLSLVLALLLHEYSKLQYEIVSNQSLNDEQSWTTLKERDWIKIIPLEKNEFACAWSDWRVLAFFCLESLFAMSASEPNFGRPAIPKISDFSENKDDKKAQRRQTIQIARGDCKAALWRCGVLMISHHCCMGCAVRKYIDLTQLPPMTLRNYHTKYFLYMQLDLTILPY